MTPAATIVEPMQPIPVAVVGVGAFGRQHARVYSGLEEAELVAVVDADADRAREVAAEFGCEALRDPRELADSVQAVSLAVPTKAHGRVGVSLLKAGLDVLVEKPFASDLETADALIEAAASNDRILQVGHLERFNPIVEAAIDTATLPLFFEVHRMSPFSPRSLDTDVVLDLMIHDLDILLALVGSAIDRIEATGLPVISTQADIASVRIVFVNGCVANLTASRISTEKIRKLRFFQPRQYVSVDYARREGVRIGLDEGQGLRFERLAVESGEPLERQLRSFLAAVKNRSQPRVGGGEARKALELALRIRDVIDRHADVLAATIAANR